LSDCAATDALSELSDNDSSEDFDASSQAAGQYRRMFTGSLPAGRTLVHRRDDDRRKGDLD
jgi:hypothetical protein